MSAAPGSGPLTLGTAGHVDHGKTALVAALTGVDTDRLPEEKARGLTIALGYAALRLPSGRPVSLVDVPGHERFVRTMVGGASGIDAFLMAISADDGVMPQTLEHAAVLRALGVSAGVVAITKADVADPARAAEQAAELLPGCPVVACSSRSGAGIAELAAVLDALAARVPSRSAAPGPPRLHVDRVFTIAGRGTVVTGTLWSGGIGTGDALELLPARRPVRVRGVEVHDAPVSRAEAGQRVAVNLVGVRAREVARGDVLAAPGAVGEATVLDCALALRGARHGERVQVHHGTRDAPGRLSALGEDLWQLRLERPLLVLDGDRVVVRRLAPPDTLGGGVVLDAAARRHGRREEILARLRVLRDGRVDPGRSEPLRRAGGAKPEPLRRAHAAPPPAPPSADRGSDRPPAALPPAALSPRAPNRPAAASTPTRPRAAPPQPVVAAPAAVAALEARLRAAGGGLLSEAQMAEELPALRALRSAGSAVRVSGRLYAHAEVVADVRGRVVALIQREGSVTLAGVRDALGLSRKSAQAFLEYLDATRVTRRLPDDRRVLPRAHAAQAEVVL
jgi:selenocysteine-specific elongation factor